MLFFKYYIRIPATLLLLLAGWLYIYTPTTHARTHRLIPDTVDQLRRSTKAPTCHSCCCLYHSSLGAAAVLSDVRVRNLHNSSLNLAKVACLPSALTLETRKTQSVPTAWRQHLDYVLQCLSIPKGHCSSQKARLCRVWSGCLS